MFLRPHWLVRVLGYEAGGAPCDWFGSCGGDVMMLFLTWRDILAVEPPFLSSPLNSSLHFSPLLSFHLSSPLLSPPLLSSLLFSSLLTSIHRDKPWHINMSHYRTLIYLICQPNFSPDSSLLLSSSHARSRGNMANLRPTPLLLPLLLLLPPLSSSPLPSPPLLCPPLPLPSSFLSSLTPLCSSGRCEGPIFGRPVRI